MAEADAISNNLNYKKGIANVLSLKGIIENRKSNHSEGLDYFKQSLKIFKTIDDKKGIASSYNSIGVTYMLQSNYKEALIYLKKSYSHYEKMEDKKKIMAGLLNIGSIYANIGNYPKAISNYKKVLKLSEEIKDEYGISYALGNLGHIYKEQGNYPLALEYYGQGFLLKEKAGDTLGMSISLNSLGNTYRSLENYDKALDYHTKSLNLQLKKGGNKSIIAKNKGNIGLIYKSKKEYSKALKIINESLEISRKINDQKQISSCLNNLGEIHLLLNKPSIARDNYKNSKDISEKIGDQFGLSHNYIGIAETYLDEKRYEKALFYTLKGKKIADELKLLEVQKKVFELLSIIYKNTGNYKKAFTSHQQFKILNDSLFNKENIEKITQLEYEYKYKQKLDLASIRELKLTKTVTVTNKNLEKSQRNYLWAIIGFLLVLILFGGIIFYQKLRNIKSETQNIVIEQKLLRSQMTPHFIFNSLSILQGMILNKEEKKSISYLSKFSKLLRIILENSRYKTVSLSQELTAIENYLTLHNLENESYKYTVLVDDIIDKSIFKIPPMLIQPFVENAIEHAFGNQKGNKTIDIQLSYLNNSLSCVIIDNGIGIDAQKEKKKHHKESLSTTITSERLKILAKDFKTNGSVIIEDRRKYNEQGTIVTLIIPHKIIVT